MCAFKKCMYLHHSITSKQRRRCYTQNCKCYRIDFFFPSFNQIIKKTYEQNQDYLGFEVCLGDCGLSLAQDLKDLPSKGILKASLSRLWMMSSHRPDSLIDTVNEVQTVEDLRPLFYRLNSDSVICVSGKREGGGEFPVPIRYFDYCKRNRGDIT